MASPANDPLSDPSQYRRQTIGKYVNRLRTVLRKNPSGAAKDAKDEKDTKDSKNAKDAKNANSSQHPDADAKHSKPDADAKHSKPDADAKHSKPNADEIPSKHPPADAKHSSPAFDSHLHSHSPSPSPTRLNQLNRPRHAADIVPILDPPDSDLAASTLAHPSDARITAQQDRARALFAKYGLTLEPHDSIITRLSRANVQRVEKPIRMRVHRTCHRCHSTFGPDRLCQKCDHNRCKKCPRYPPKKDDSSKSKARPVHEPAAAPIVSPPAPARHNVPAIGSKPAKKVEYLTMKSRTGGLDLERRPAKQRVRRMCHKCDALFVPPTATSCPACSHLRCTKCPRDPAKKKKWPDGYPGDVPASASNSSDSDQDVAKTPDRTWRKPRQRVRWNCEACQTLFVTKAKTCSNCGHHRCPTCPRAPPKKPRKDHDSAVWRSVEEKLSRFKLDQPTSATETAPLTLQTTVPGAPGA